MQQNMFVAMYVVAIDRQQHKNNQHNSTKMNQTIDRRM